VSAAFCAYHCPDPDCTDHYLCLGLDQTGQTQPIEPRRYQSGDDQYVQITLSGPILGDDSCVTVSTDCTDGSTPAPGSVVEDPPGTLTLTYNSQHLPNAECCLITLTDDALGTVDVRMLLGDVSRNGAVNAADRNLINAEVGTWAYTSSVFWYDLDKNNAINAADRNICNAQIGTELDAGCPEIGGDSPGGEPTGELTLELWPLGSDGPATTLLPGTTYEVHYSTDADCVNDYTLFAVATSSDQGFGDAEPASSGAWSETGNSFFGELDAPVPAPGYEDGYARYQMVSDQLACSENEDVMRCAGTEGHLCNITTQGTGELNLQLYLVGVDEDGAVVHETSAQGVYEVEDAADE